MPDQPVMDPSSWTPPTSPKRPKSVVIWVSVIAIVVVLSGVVIVGLGVMRFVTELDRRRGATETTARVRPVEAIDLPVNLVSRSAEGWSKYDVSTIGLTAEFPTPPTRSLDMNWGELPQGCAAVAAFKSVDIDGYDITIDLDAMRVEGEDYAKDSKTFAEWYADSYKSWDESYHAKTTLAPTTIGGERHFRLVIEFVSSGDSYARVILVAVKRPFYLSVHIETRGPNALVRASRTAARIADTAVFKPERSALAAREASSFEWGSRLSTEGPLLRPW